MHELNFKKNKMKQLHLIALLVMTIIFSASAQSKIAKTATKKHTLLIVLAHGDDLASITPLPAKYAAEGHTVYFAIFTGLQDSSGNGPGSKGHEELLCASRALDIKETFVLRGPEGQGHELNKAIAERLIELINQTKPDVIVTWGPDGVTGHPGHIGVGNIVTRVFQQQALLKHKPRKLYYIAYPEKIFPGEGLPIGGISDQVPLGTVSETFITTVVDCSLHLEKSQKAITCHTIPDTKNRERQERYGRGTFVEGQNEKHRTILRGKIYLRLVFPPTAGKETDIFKGL